MRRRHRRVRTGSQSCRRAGRLEPVRRPLRAGWDLRDRRGSEHAVPRQGRTSLIVATFPAQPRTCTTPFPAPPVQESVPTTVVRGPDKALYVGELTGFPFCAGLARIWRVVPGEQPKVFLSGFKMIIDMAYAKDGTLYVRRDASSPFALGGPGQIVRVAVDGTVLDPRDRRCTSAARRARDRQGRCALRLQQDRHTRWRRGASHPPLISARAGRAGCDSPSDRHGEVPRQP